ETIVGDIARWDAIAEERIRTAQDEGEFDRLPGFGQPLAEADLRDPNWWIKRKLKSEGLSLLPPILEAKLAREKTLASIGELRCESEVRQRLMQLNEQIRRASCGPQIDPPVPL